MWLWKLQFVSFSRKWRGAERWGQRQTWKGYKHYFHFRNELSSTVAYLEEEWTDLKIRSVPKYEDSGISSIIIHHSSWSPHGIFLHHHSHFVFIASSQEEKESKRMWMKIQWNLEFNIILIKKKRRNRQLETGGWLDGRKNDVVI